MSTHSFQIAQAFGDGLPYERERIVHETKFFMGASAEAMLEAGNRLIQIKENEAHGDFTAIATERLGLSERTARQMMAAALRFRSPQLESKRQALAVLGKTKIFELMTEDDEELAALADGGTVAGLNLDEIERMSSRELRDALREARGDIDAKERQLSDKDSKINNLDRRLKKRLKEMTPDKEAEELRQEVSGVSLYIESNIIGTLREGFESLTGNTASSEIDHEAFMAGCCAQIERALIQVRQQFDIKAAPEANPMPEWAKPEEEAVEA